MNYGKGSLLTLAGLFIFSGWLHAQQTLSVSSGTTMKVAGGNLILNNTDLNNNGTTDAGAATVSLTGNAGSGVSGTAAPLIQVLQINKSGGSIVNVSGNLNVTNSIVMQSGKMNVSANAITLLPAATVINETEINRITTSGNGKITSSSFGVSNPNQFNAGNLGAVITSSANLGALNISRSGVAATNPSMPSFAGILRTYLITPQNNTTLNATLRFYYLDAELNGRNESILNLWKSTDGINWSLIGADSRNSTLNYVEKNGIADFSYWTLSDALNVVPVTLSFYSVMCEGDHATIRWKTQTEINAASFSIEKSTDGSSWRLLQNIPALNNSTGASYSVTDKDPSAKTYYRIRSISADGTFSYSPVFSGGCNDIAMPLSIFPNPVKTTAALRFSVRIKTDAIITVYDAGGKLVYKTGWALSAGTNLLQLPAEKLSPGNYFIRLTAANIPAQSVSFIKL